MERAVAAHHHHHKETGYFVAMKFKGCESLYVRRETEYRLPKS